MLFYNNWFGQKTKNPTCLLFVFSLTWTKIEPEQEAKFWADGRVSLSTANQRYVCVCVCVCVCVFMCVCDLTQFGLSFFANELVCNPKLKRAAWAGDSGTNFCVCCRQHSENQHGTKVLHKTISKTTSRRLCTGRRFCALAPAKMHSSEGSSPMVAVFRAFKVKSTSPIFPQWSNSFKPRRNQRVVPVRGKIARNREVLESEKLQDMCEKGTVCKSVLSEHNSANDMAIKRFFIFDIQIDQSFKSKEIRVMLLRRYLIKVWMVVCLAPEKKGRRHNHTLLKYVSEVWSQSQIK